MWGLTATLVTLGAACLPLLRARDAYFRDDTEIGAYPIWVALGRSLRQGDWPLLDPSAWMAGNLAAEGQWGLYSPTNLLVSLGATAAGSAVSYTTAVKLGFLLVASLGTFVLARTYGVRPPLAFVAGVAVPLNGFTIYMDAPSWVTGLVTWALLPWAWAGLRRTTRSGAGPVLFLVAAGCIVTVGYVHGFLALGVVIVAVGVDRLLRRDLRSVVPVLAAGVFCLLLALLVYLPGVLTADVTARDNEAILNSAFLTGNLTGLLSASSPTTVYQVAGWWGGFTTAPLMYVAWFLPLLALVSWSRVAEHVVELRDVVIVGAVAALVVVGPSDLGPLRFPVRVMPYVALAVVLAAVFLLDRSWPLRPSGRQVGAAGAWIVLAAYLGFAQRPEALRGPALASALGVLLGAGLVLLLARGVLRLASSGRLAAAAVVLAAGSVTATAAQVGLFPASPLPHFDVPGDPARYEALIPEAVNDVIMVGSPLHGVDPDVPTRFDDERRPPRQPERGAVWDELAVGNSWLLNRAAVQNTYSVIQHEAYQAVTCMNHRGETCPQLLDRLFRAQPRVFVPLVDLLSVDTVLVVKADVPRERWEAPPPGWSEVADRQRFVTWVRDRPVGPAGGVTWTSPGTRVTELARGPLGVRLEVESVGQDGARAVLSRIDWPGYRVRGASARDEPLNGFLLDLDLSGAQPGDVVEVSFRPPGWELQLASGGLALVIAAVWTGLHLRRRSRPRSASSRMTRPGGRTALPVLHKSQRS